MAGVHVFIPAFSPDATLRAIQDHQIGHTLLVPTMVNMAVNAPNASDFDLSSLKYVTHGASPMPEAVIIKAGSDAGVWL